MQTSFCYLLHFARPISDKHTCQHYLGSADDVDARLREHLTGRGARLTQVALERGIDFEIVRVWRAEPGQGRQLERKLKNLKAGPQLCPLCSSERKRRREQLSLGLEYCFTLEDLTELAF